MPWLLRACTGLARVTFPTKTRPCVRLFKREHARHAGASGSPWRQPCAAAKSRLLQQAWPALVTRRESTAAYACSPSLAMPWHAPLCRISLPCWWSPCAWACVSAVERAWQCVECQGCRSSVVCLAILRLPCSWLSTTLRSYLRL